MSRTARTIEGRSGTIRLDRTVNGVATIRARTRDDALRGLGYCHARDRGLQLLFVRILGRGEGSRWFRASDRMLAIDRYFRRLNFLSDIAAETAALTPSVRSAVDSYSAGLNAYFEEKGLPWELKLVGYAKGHQPWSFADSVLTGKMIGYVSLGSTQGEIERWIVDCVRAGVPVEALEELFPDRLGGIDPDLYRRLTIDEPVIPEALWSVPCLPWAVASNSWVVGGERSASGLPILANDPHLEINRIPPIWYEASLRWEAEDGRSRYALGATMPGAPGVVLGRNNEVSWGVTYSYMDCVDSWVEDCRDGHYRRGDDWKPLRVRVETIERKGVEPATATFYETDEHGTIVGDPTEPGLYLSTRWSCGEGTAAGAVGAVVEMLDARDVDEGRTILARLNNSAWNFVLADRSGSIGSQMSGRMPVRREGTSGLLPLPGWDPANDWRGFVPFEDLPRSLNPDDGLIVAANNDLNHLGREQPINVVAVPYRAERIRQLLEAADAPLTTGDMLAIQLDHTSCQARRFLTLLLPLLDDDPNAEPLRTWDGDYTPGSRGAALFERFYAALYDIVFGGRLGPSAVEHLRRETVLIAEYYAMFDRVLLSERSAWFGGQDRETIYREAWDRAQRDDEGDGAASRPVKFKHLMLGDKLPSFVGMDRGPYPVRGGRASVCQRQVTVIAGRESVGAPSYRLVVDMATDEIRSALPGGPSDRRLSPWYGTEIEDYLAGKMKVVVGRDHEG